MEVLSKREKFRLARELLGQKSAAACLLDLLLISAAFFVFYYSLFLRRLGAAGAAVTAAAALSFTGALAAFIFSILLDRKLAKRRAEAAREHNARRALICEPETLLRFAAEHEGVSGFFCDGCLVGKNTLAALLRLFPGELVSPGALLPYRDAATRHGRKTVLLFCTSGFSPKTIEYSKTLDVDFRLVPAEGLLSFEGLEQILPALAVSAPPGRPRQAGIKKAFERSAAGYVRCALLILAARLLTISRPAALNAYYLAAAAFCLAASGLSLLKKVGKKA